jgi:hypothetical protein
MEKRKKKYVVPLENLNLNSRKIMSKRVEGPIGHSSGRIEVCTL